MANIERSNIHYRLNSGRQNFIEKGGKLGRKAGTKKSPDKMKEEYKDVFSYQKVAIPSEIQPNYQITVLVRFNE